MISTGLLTLAAATSILHIIAWVGFIGFYIGYFVVWLLSTVFGFLGYIARAVILFLYELVRSLSGPLSWIAASGGVLLLFLTFRFGTRFLKGLALSAPP